MYVKTFKELNSKDTLIAGGKGASLGEMIQNDIPVPDGFVVLADAFERFIEETDEGGLSCHAAIVAREMKKPCIIGTKIATKKIKDGDLIEVDANKGIVRIIKN